MGKKGYKKEVGVSFNNEVFMYLWAYLDLVFLFTYKNLLCLPGTQVDKHIQTSNKFNEYQEPDFAPLGIISYMACASGP